LESKNVSLSEKAAQQEKSNLEQVKLLNADHNAKTDHLNEKITELFSHNKSLLVKQKEQEEAARRSREAVKKLSAELTQMKKENMEMETKQAAVCKKLDENNKKIEDTTFENNKMNEELKKLRENLLLTEEKKKKLVAENRSFSDEIADINADLTKAQADFL